MTASVRSSIVEYVSSPSSHWRKMLEPVRESARNQWFCSRECIPLVVDYSAATAGGKRQRNDATMTATATATAMIIAARGVRHSRRTRFPLSLVESASVSVLVPVAKQICRRHFIFRIGRPSHRRPSVRACAECVCPAKPRVATL